MPYPTQEEERWHLALQDGTFGIWDLSPRIETVQYSPQWKARLGFGQIHSPDSTSFWRSRVHPDDFNPMLRALRLHLDGYTATYNMRFRLRAGNFRYVEVRSRGRVVERDARGDAVRMVGTMVDLTQRWPEASRAAAAWPHRADVSSMDPEAARLPVELGDLLDLALRDAGR
jgi:PAS domain-containing protein